MAASGQKRKKMTVNKVIRMSYKTLDSCFAKAATAGVLSLVLLMPGLLSASELRLHYQALEKLLRRQVFTESGRHYLIGNLGSRCTYAYLANPRVTPQADRLRITADFRGRAAATLLGECVGPAEAFNVSATGVPVYRQGVLRLNDVKVDHSNPLYADLIRAFLESLQYSLVEEVQKLAQQVSGTGGYEMRVPTLSVHTVRVGVEAIVFSFDIAVQVR
jgi:hypothetical protein